MTKRAFGTLYAFAGQLIIALCWNAIPAHAQSIHVDWVRERLTIIAADVPLADVLAEVGRQTGSTFVDAQRAAGTITIEIRSARLLDALRTLLAETNYIMSRPQWTSADAGPQVVVWLHGRAPKGLSDPCGATTSASAGRVRCDPEVRMSDVMLSGDAALSHVDDDVTTIRPETEAARLERAGFFNVNVAESSLLTAAKSSDPDVRVRALQTIGIQGTKAGLQALRDGLNDPNPFVRAEALDMLVSQGTGSESVRQLTELLDHKDPAVRFPAVVALGEQSGDEAEFQLKRALNDDDDAVKESAAQLLQQKELQKRKKNP